MLGVWAHPDDEAYLSTVLMHRIVESGGRVVVVTATRGELGSNIRPPSRRRSPSVANRSCAPRWR
jgi:LmbE family N-acetylglucosaminyl deacetylase